MVRSSNARVCAVSCRFGASLAQPPGALPADCAKTGPLAGGAINRYHEGRLNEAEFAARAANRGIAMRETDGSVPDPSQLEMNRTGPAASAHGDDALRSRNGAEAPGAGPARAAASPQIDRDLLRPEHYLIRELTWLAFNRRVLAEAEDARNPLLERLKFLAITASNLDEFFMKRIGGLKQQEANGVLDLTPDGHTPRWQIDQCYEVVRAQELRQQQVLVELRGLLKAAGIEILRYRDLSQEIQQELR